MDDDKALSVLFWWIVLLVGLWFWCVLVPCLLAPCTQLVRLLHSGG